ncbi:acyl-CoA dehydrogenase family protein, partial [Streptomyces sp. NPDC057428]|uniref:acyl-CoA dehydrogenase family protein n=1 Tax=Streptomyces sp. NPDC057428 TaxID=3346129 RepID=UPI0036BF82E5
MAWEAVGVMLAAYRIALDYTREREQFGGPVARFQLAQDLLVRMLSDATACLGMVVRLAQLEDEGTFRDEHSAMAKAHCTTRMREVVGWGRELLAGNGIVLDYSIGCFVADAEALYSYEGTREINTLITRSRAHRPRRLRLSQGSPRSAGPDDAARWTSRMGPGTPAVVKDRP